MKIERHKGSKTWSRYESGESIRHDKVTSICKTRNWHLLPGQDELTLYLIMEDCILVSVLPKLILTTLSTGGKSSYIVLHKRVHSLSADGYRQKIMEEI